MQLSLVDEKILCFETEFVGIYTYVYCVAFRVSSGCGLIGDIECMHLKMQPTTSHKMPPSTSLYTET